MHRAITRLLSTRVPISCARLTPHIWRSQKKIPSVLPVISQKLMSSQIDRKFTEVLSNEIKQERENMYDCSPPRGFSVTKSNGSEIILSRKDKDGVCIEVEINLAGSVNPDVDEDENSQTEQKDVAPVLEAHPEVRIRLVKPSGKSAIFNCSLPSSDARQQLTADEANSNLPTYSVDSVEMEGIPGYFVYTDLFDDNMYDHTMQLLMERKLDVTFQQELQDFCTSEEHKLYLKFLDEFQSYCQD